MLAYQQSVLFGSTMRFRAFLLAFAPCQSPLCPLPAEASRPHRAEVVGVPRRVAKTGGTHFRRLLYPHVCLPGSTLFMPPHFLLESLQDS